ncbi:MAG: AsmA family protein [Desulfobulbaceae bacterium]|nr:AsmA family protein [Desulfobulbaceae bacterium]
MNKFLTYCLLGAGGLAGVALLGAGYLAATFNPNDYKEKIIQTVHESKNRTLKIDGDVKLSFFPNVGAELGKVSLSEVKSDKELITVDKMRVSLALLPLFSKQVMVQDVSISGLQTTIFRQNNGSTNIDDLLASQKKAPSLGDKKTDSQHITFDIAAISIEKTSFTYRDEATAKQYSIKELCLKSGRLANNTPTTITLSAVVQASAPNVDLSSRLQSTLTFDLDKKQYRLEDMDLQMKGTAFDTNDLNLQASGTISANLTSHEFSTAKLSFKAMGVKAKERFEASLLAQNVTLAKDTFSGDVLTANTKLDGESGSVTAAFSLPGLEGSAKSFKSSAFSLDLNVKQAEQALTLKLSSPLSGNVKEQQLHLDNLTLTLNATGEKLPSKSQRAELKGKSALSLSKESVELDLSGRLAQSQIKAKINTKGFASPSIQFDLDVDQFDADLYLPPKKAAPPAPKAAKEAEQSFDLSGLRKLNMSGKVHIGALKVANVKSTAVSLDLKAHDGQVEINPLSANLYDGSVKGSLAIDATNTPKITITQNLIGINVAPLTKDAANFDTLEGRGDVGLDLSMQGNTVSRLKNMMNGTMSLNLADGAIQGINIAKQIRDAQNILGMSGANNQTQSANSAEKTDFTELKATFAINKGVAHNDDLSLKSPLLRLSGAGDIDIAHDSMDYLAKATLAATLKGQGGRDDLNGIPVPVRVKGPFSALKYTLDFAAIGGETVKQKADAVKEQVKTKVQDQINTRLQGFFK